MSRAAARRDRHHRPTPDDAPFFTTWSVLQASTLPSDAQAAFPDSAEWILGRTVLLGSDRTLARGLFPVLPGFTVQDAVRHGGTVLGERAEEALRRAA